MRIKKELREEVQAQLQSEYVEQFGPSALSNEARPLTRSDAIDIYAKNLRFWKQRTPELTELKGERELARHAICTNAENNLLKRVRQLGIEDEVKDLSNQK